MRDPPSESPTAGEVLFARYAYPPNELGYCGTGDGSDLLGVAAGRVTTSGGGNETTTKAGDVVRSARGFDGAWPYLQMIAAAAGIDDPLDAAVVEAYWIGNTLLGTVSPPAFSSAVRQCFAGQSGADWDCLDQPTVAPPVPHHSFHVFAIYPWAKLLRSGRGGPALHVLDRCRVRWGEVVAVEGDHVSVRYQPLVWDGRSISLGPPVLERTLWTHGGQSLLASVTAGDWVSMHWDWVCDQLSEAQLSALQHFTARQLDATNASGRAAAFSTGAGGPTTSKTTPVQH